MPDLHPDIQDLVSPTVGTYNTIVPKARIIEPSEWTPTNNTLQARLTLTRFILSGLLEDSYAMLSTAHRYRPDSIPFKLILMHVLSVAAPGCILAPEQDGRKIPSKCTGRISFTHPSHRKTITQQTILTTLPTRPNQYCLRMSTTMMGTAWTTNTSMTRISA